MGLKIYSTLARKKVPFKPLEEGRVRMYVCGPTVYDKAHMGHAMSSVVFDVIRRYLEYSGYEVTHVMNYTDVDDKVIQRANEIGEDPLALAAVYIDEYDAHLCDLNIMTPSVRPRASEEIEHIVQLVRALEEKGHAYQVNGDVFFRVASDEEYGKLSGRRLEEMRAGFRIDVDERKEDPADFALWKAAKPGEPAWDSPWGKGRPGWHIECSAMSMHYFGEQIDIHGGGNDLIFPHHENEIAQTESLTGKEFSRYWVHNGMMQLGGEDMSKSTGNVFNVEDFLKEHDSDVFRMLVLNGHYRGPLTFNEDVIQQAARAVERLHGALKPAVEADGAGKKAQADLAAQVKSAQAGFKKAMDDDFNTAGALGSVFELVRAINQARDAGVNQETLSAAQEALLELAGVLGLRMEEKRAEVGEAAPFIELLIELRTRLRQQEDWELADLIRKSLVDLGVMLEDGKEGTTWRAK
jgi:cysteinyl-tRNA synthetase